MLEVAVAAKPLMLVTVNVAELLPDATVTVAGTVAAAVLLLARVTVTPPDGALVLSVTVPVEVDAVPLGLLVMLAGLSETDEIAGGLSVKFPFADPRIEVPDPVAVIVTIVAAPTLLVVAVNVCVVAPIDTRMELGMDTEAELTDRLTVRRAVEAPAATGPFSVTVPVELAAPPCTLVGIHGHGNNGWRNNRQRG